MHDKFDLYYADVGSYIEGAIYCAENDYENAVDFYSNPKNYSYYCILGVDSDTTSTRVLEIPEIDTDKFDALLEFAYKSNYDPFDKDHNSNIEKAKNQSKRLE